MSATALPYAHLGDALATDYFNVRDQFTDEQWEHFLSTRRFVDSEVLPAINQYCEAAELPWPLMRRLVDLGLYGEDIEGYGCPGMSPTARGLVNMELHRGDGSLGTFFGVQSGLAMKSIAPLGQRSRSSAGCRRWPSATRSGRSP
jgi:glutaryl-CoA dehydrogenase